MSKFLSVALLAGASAIAALVPSQAEAVTVALWGGVLSGLMAPTTVIMSWISAELCGVDC